MLVRDAIVAWVTPDQHGHFIGPPVRPRSRAGRECLAKHLRDAIGDVDVNELGAGHVWHVQQHCQSLGLSNATCNHVTHSVLRALLRDLESVGLVDASVFSRLRRAKPLRKVKPERLMAYDAEQRDRAIEAFRGHWAFAIVAFLFLTGCRVGEAAGLQWRDVGKRTISIMRGRTGREITDCKTDHSQRVIGCPDALLAVLAALPRRGDEDFVFLGRHGKLPVDVHTLRARAWVPVLARAGLPPLPIHGARHTWATIALTSGIPIAQVAAHLGNTEREVAKTYSHVLPRFDPNAAIGRPITAGPPLTPPSVLAITGERPRLYRVK